MSRTASAARRRAIAAATVVSLATATLAYSIVAGLAPVAPVNAVTTTIPSVTNPSGTVTVPGGGGAAIAAADGEQIFAARDLDRPRVLASITKVITALVVLDAYPIDEGASGAAITLTAADSALPARYRAMNGTVAPAPQGTVVTQRDVIQLMIVPSANNYAETLAVWAFGSIDGYLDAARVWLSARGLDAITVGDAAGFSVANTGTPRELVELARIALGNEVIATAAALPSVTVPGIGTFETTNLALGRAGVTGIKTGTLDGFGANLLFASTVAIGDSTTEVVGVVLGLSDQEAVAAAVSALVTTAADDFSVVTLVEPGTTVATYTTPWGDSARLVTGESEPVVVWGDATSRAILETPPFVVGSEDQPPASLVILISGRRTTIPLQWEGTISAPPLSWQLMQPFEQLVGG
ncbi:MAG: hypothetical protein RLZZ608_137 [Actinomycetota bacterium]|jgi:D-alanyl-D-alanine carboxypeptidase (penicillin-binding protein 5/6)